MNDTLLRCVDGSNYQCLKLSHRGLAAELNSVNLLRLNVQPSQSCGNPRVVTASSLVCSNLSGI